MLDLCSHVSTIFLIIPLVCPSLRLPIHRCSSCQISPEVLSGSAGRLPCVLTAAAVQGCAAALLWTSRIPVPLARSAVCLRAGLCLLPPTHAAAAPSVPRRRVRSVSISSPVRSCVHISLSVPSSTWAASICPDCPPSHCYYCTCSHRSAVVRPLCYALCYLDLLLQLDLSVP
jgi:hypothetical protein